MQDKRCTSDLKELQVHFEANLSTHAEHIFKKLQACPILTTCSSHESEDSSCTSRTTCASGECGTFHENKMTSDLVKLHLIKEGPGLANSYKSYDSFRS